MTTAQKLYGPGLDGEPQDPIRPDNIIAWPKSGAQPERTGARLDPAREPADGGGADRAQMARHVRGIVEVSAATASGRIEQQMRSPEPRANCHALGRIIHRVIIEFTALIRPLHTMRRKWRAF